MDDIHSRLTESRIKAGYETATDAAKAMGVNVPTYLGHENGNRGITRSAAVKYARFFQVSLEWLLTGTGSSKDVSLLDSLPPKAQEEALHYIEFLREKYRME